MSRLGKRLFFAGAFALTFILPARAGEPGVLRDSVVGDDPYRWTGLSVITNGIFVSGSASGVVVRPKVYVTAAHVVFDEEAGGWRAPETIRFAPGHHDRRFGAETGRPAAMFYTWDTYRTRKMEDSGEAGTSSMDAFNLDFAAGILVGEEPWMPDGSYARTFVNDPGNVALMRETRRLMVVGYPAESGFIAERDIGYMHATPSEFHDVRWFAAESRPDSHFDSGGFPIAVHFIEGTVAYAGNSGGPVFVEGDDQAWYLNAILVGGSHEQSEFSIVRGVNADAWMLIEEASKAASSGYSLPRPEAPTAVATNRSVSLSWSRPGGSASSIVIERRSDAGFVVIGEVDAAVTSYVDEAVSPGTGYTYRVIARDGDGNQAPPSPEVSVDIPGSSLAVGSALGARGLFFTTGGDASAHVKSRGLITGSIESMESSYIELSLIGPGILTFDWRVSSEANSDFKDPGSDLYGEIYDAFHFYHNDVRVAFLSGEEGPLSRTVTVPGGSHVFRWSYEKDPYTDEGHDAGFLSNVSWTPQNQSLYFYGAIDAGPVYRRTAWFGFHTYADLPWAYSYEHGWLYLVKASNHDLWAYDTDAQIGWMYLSPATFPYVYLHQYDGWAYYYTQTGIGGSGRWFYLYEEERFFDVE